MSFKSPPVTGWAASPKARPSPMSRRVAGIGLPFPKRNRRVAGTRSGQSQSDHLWLHFLAEGKLSRAAEVRAALKLAVDKYVQLVIPGRHVADVDALHAALAQSLELFGAVDVVRNELPVDLEPHGVEAHRVALGQLDEDGDLCP